MIDYEKIITDIERQDILDITTKELKEYGLNDYYIKKAVDKNLLEKSGRGKYRIVRTHNIKKGKKSFFNFVLCALRKDFEGAFQNLYKAHSLQDNLYSNNYRICFLLLKQLVTAKHDFSFMDDILDFIDMSSNTSEFNTIFTQFRYDVMSDDYINAFINISKLKELHYKKNHSVPVNINVFYTLTEAVVKKQEMKPKKETSSSFDHIFSIFKIYLKKEDYEGALEFLEKNNYCIPDNKKDLVAISLKLLQCYLDVKNNGTILQEKAESSNENTCNYYEQCFENIFHDNYLEAYKDSNALIYYYPYDENFQLYQKLLEKIVEQNKINIQKISTDKKKIESQDIKIKNPIHLSITNISQLVHNKDYATLRALLEDNGLQDNNYGRLSAFLLTFLLQMEKYQSDTFAIEGENHTYKHTYCFNRFFEALRFHDYEEAYAMSIQCQKKLFESGKDTQEFSLYKIVLEDLLHIKSKALFQRKVNTQINNIVFAKKDILPNLEELEQLLIQRAEFNSLEECNDDYYDTLALNIIDTIFTVLENPTIVRDSFATFSLDYTNLVDSFMEALQSGSYVSAFLITNDKNWYSETTKHKHSKYFILYKKLLQVLNRSLVHNEAAYEVNNKKIELDISYSDNILKIKTLMRLIKHYQIDEALAYYQENYEYFRDYLNDDLNSMIMANFYLFANQSIEFLEEHKQFYKKKGKASLN